MPNRVNKDWKVPTSKKEWLALQQLLEHSPILPKNIAHLLVKAAEAEQWEIVSKLLELGVDVNARIDDGDYKGASALWFAVYYHQYGLVKKLVENGADVNVTLKSLQSDNLSALYVAAVQDSIEIVDFLLEHGADSSINPTGTINRESLESLLYQTQLCRFATISTDDIIDQIPNISGELPTSYYCQYLQNILEDPDTIISPDLKRLDEYLKFIKQSQSVNNGALVKIIKDALYQSNQQPVVFYSGWYGEETSPTKGHEGHAIIIQLQYDKEKNLIITIYNSGQGREYNDPSWNSNPVRFAAALVLKIPAPINDTDIDELYPLRSSFRCRFANSDIVQSAIC